VARAAAALLVVAFHAKLTLIRFDKSDYWHVPFIYEHGEYGVHFFFVISGFIIAYVLSRPSNDPASFLIRRLFRIWPLYALCTIVFSLAYLLQRNLPASKLGYGADYIFASLMIWPQRTLPALHPGWSLEHEVIFYLFAAICCAVAGLRFFVAFIALNVVAGQLIFNILPAFGINFTFWDYHLLARVNVYFLWGIALFLFASSLRFVGVVAPLSFGLIIFIGGAYLQDEIASVYARRIVEAVFIGGGSFTILLALLNIDHSASSSVRHVRKSWPWRGMVWLGDRSYSLYLVHFIFVIVFQVIHRDFVRWPEYMAEPLCVAFILASVALAALTYPTIEQPANNAGHRIAQRFQRDRTATTRGSSGDRAAEQGKSRPKMPA